MSIGILKSGKGIYKSDKTELKEDDIFLLDIPSSTEQLVNKGEDGKNPYISAKDLVSNNVDTIISGNGIIWEDGYDYTGTPYKWIKRGVEYSSETTPLPIDPANVDNTINRTDSIVLTFDSNGKGIMAIKKGIEGLVAVAPVINQETEIFLLNIDVDGGTTQPSNITELVMYDEDETVVDVNGAPVVANATGAYSGNVCISATNFTTADSFYVKQNSDFNPNTFKNFIFKVISTSGVWDNFGTIKIALIDNLNNIISDTVILDSSLLNTAGNPFSFDSSLNLWQTVAIPISVFKATSSSARGIIILKDDNRGTDSFKIDLIRLQSGLDTPNSSIYVTFDDLPPAKTITEGAGINVVDTPEEATISIKFPTLPVISPVANDYLAFMGGTDSLVSAITPLNAFPLSLFKNDLEIEKLNIVNGDNNTNLNAVIRYLNTDGLYWLTTASNPLRSTTELVATNDILISSGSTISAVKKGNITGFTGLVVGDKYYLNTILGSITNNTSGFVSTDTIRYVGTAISTTSLYFNPSIATPDSSLSVRDVNNIEQFNSSYIQFDGLEFDIPNKRVIGSALQRNTLFLSSTGNDATAQENNPKSPFLTLDGAVTHLLTQAHLGLNWYIETLDNGTFTYTLASKIVNGFNFINLSSATIIIKNAIEITTQWNMYCPTGTIIYEYADSSTLINNTFIYAVSNSTRRSNHFIENTIIRNTTTGGLNITYGLIRDVGSVTNWIWVNTTIEDTGVAITLSKSLNDEQLYFVNIINNTNSNGITPLTGNYKIDNYTNNSTSLHKLNGSFIIIGNVSSPSALTEINAHHVTFVKNISFQNTYFSPNLLYYSRVIDGRNNKLSIDNTISTPLISKIRNRKSTSNIQVVEQTAIYNLSIDVAVGSLTPYLVSFDIRPGENGGQLILDNVDLYFRNNVFVFEVLEQSSTFIAKNQVIFRNSVRIINGNNLHDDGWTTTPAGILQDIFVKENASIYHDFGVISATAEFQATIPNISTY